MKKRGWACERIADGQGSVAIAALRAVTRARALLVVDYSETRVGLRQMLTALAGDQGAGVRVLLLARDVGDWWDQLGAGEPAAWDLVQAASSAHLLLSPVVAADLSDADVIALAVRSFAQELGLPERTVEIYGDVGTGQRRVLDLHAAALVAVLAEPPMELCGSTSVRFSANCSAMSSISGTTARGPTGYPAGETGQPRRRYGRSSPPDACSVRLARRRPVSCPPGCRECRRRPRSLSGCGCSIRLILATRIRWVRYWIFFGVRLMVGTRLSWSGRRRPGHSRARSRSSPTWSLHFALRGFPLLRAQGSRRRR